MIDGDQPCNIKLADIGLRPDPVTVEQLWAEAEKYGVLYVFGSHHVPAPARYRVQIDFATEGHVELSVSSERNRTLAVALTEAIEQAKKVAAQFRETIS